MKITVLCDSPAHPVMAWLQRWGYVQPHEVEIVTDKAGLAGGDLLFLISCGQIITRAERAKYRKALVIHAADLPRGRGWSPHIWQIIEGETAFTLTLLEAADKVDSGAIWHQVQIDVPKHALCAEVNAALFRGECDLMDWAVENFATVIPREQVGDPTYYPRRTPADGQLDVHKSVAEQFDLMRISDPDRYPAFFELHGHRYRVRLEKL